MSNLPSFEYVDVLPRDLKVPGDAPFSQDEWIANRMMLFNDVESWIALVSRRAQPC